VAYLCVYFLLEHTCNT